MLEVVLRGGEHEWAGSVSPPSVLFDVSMVITR